jgi:hypothetical protein
MLFTGTQGDYNWLASHRQESHLAKVLRACPQLVLGKFVAILSFDSGPLTPTPEEIKAGWSSDGRIMYSPRITDASTIPFEHYDEWLIFPNETHVLPELEVFINWGAFSLADEPNGHPELRERLWSQLARIGPESYVAEGDYFLLATSDDLLFERAAAAVRALSVA